MPSDDYTKIFVNMISAIAKCYKYQCNIVDCQKNIIDANTKMINNTQASAKVKNRCRAYLKISKKHLPIYVKRARNDGNCLKDSKEVLYEHLHKPAVDQTLMNRLHKEFNLLK